MLGRCYRVSKLSAGHRYGLAGRSNGSVPRSSGGLPDCGDAHARTTPLLVAPVLTSIPGHNHDEGPAYVVLLV